MEDQEIVYKSIGEVKNNFSKPDDPKKIRAYRSEVCSQLVVPVGLIRLA